MVPRTYGGASRSACNPFNGLLVFVHARSPLRQARKPGLQKMETTYRIELYEIIGEGGRYFHVTVRAASREGAIAQMRKTYESSVYRLAGVAVSK